MFISTIIASTKSRDKVKELANRCCGSETELSAYIIDWHWYPVDFYQKPVVLINSKHHSARCVCAAVPCI